jgi:hypothetical protein
MGAGRVGPLFLLRRSLARATAWWELRQPSEESKDRVEAIFPWCCLCRPAEIAS